MARVKKGLTHLDASNRARMVDIGNKEETRRVAVAQARVKLSAQAFKAIVTQSVRKGEVLGVAQLAGIAASKRTSELIPLCHPLLLEHVSVNLKPDHETHSVLVRAEATAHGKTGVEMEALVAVSLAALTVYDMCKSLDRGITITDISLLKKTGGKGGTFKRKGAEHRS